MKIAFLPAAGHDAGHVVVALHRLELRVGDLGHGVGGAVGLDLVAVGGEFVVRAIAP